MVRYTKKRKAWGCGFCAALHRQFEKHIDHVAIHFDTGSTKADWLHSNVIYGLLHQDPIHELWKNQLAENQHMFEGHHPQYSWIPETTGRAQGYAENENPGQLQDLLEFFDGSKESAEKVVRVAWRTMQVLLQPKGTPSITQSSLLQRSHSSASNLHKHVSIASPSPRAHQLRRAMSNAAFPKAFPNAKRAEVRSSASTPAGFPAAVPGTFVQSPPPPLHPNHSAFHQGFVPPHNRTSSLDKELPPVPPGTDMETDLAAMDLDLDLSVFGNAPDAPGALLLPPGMAEDWTSRANTLVNGMDGGDPMAVVGSLPPNQQFAPPAAAGGWPDMNMNMFGTNPNGPGGFR